MSDLADWLLAQIDEDEKVARASSPWNGDDDDDVTPEQERRWESQPHEKHCGWRIGEGMARECECGYPARVLAECEAKRELVKWATEPVVRYDPYTPSGVDHLSTRAGVITAWADKDEQVDVTDAWNVYAAAHTVPRHEDALRLLALPYADRDGYRQEWRP